MTEEIRAEIPRLKKGLAACPDWVAAEMADFSEEQMRFTRQEPVWARWSAETQLRHMVNVPFRWLVEQMGPPLRARGYAFPPLDVAAIQKGSGRHIPPEVCPDRPSLIAFMRPLFAFAAGILDKETPESLRSMTCLRMVDPEAWREDSPEKPIDFWRMAAKLHPYGVREDPALPGRFTLEMMAALRQVYWEILAHTRTTQRIKGLLGLPVRVTLPREGYLTISKFHD